MSSVQLRTGPPRAAQHDHKLKHPPLGEQARQLLQLLLLLAAVLGVLWLLDRMVAQ